MIFLPTHYLFTVFSLWSGNKNSTTETIRSDKKCRCKGNYNNSLKFETTQTGDVVTGVLTATTFSGNLVGGGSGISTFYDLRVTNLTVEGTTTTLDTNLVG